MSYILLQDKNSQGSISIVAHRVIEISRGLPVLATQGQHRYVRAISRPVVNHKGCITTLCTLFFQGPLEKVISKCRYLTKDLFETIERLRETIPREQHLLQQPCTVINTSNPLNTTQRHTFPRAIYTADIKAFYPSTPHALILEAYESFNPAARSELHLIETLLAFNFITNGKDIYYMGQVGIPMGLTLAPLLARMCTAHLLRGFQTPLPGPHTLTVYYDNVAGTFALDQQHISNLSKSLAPYELSMTACNTTQDSIFNPVSGNFLPFCQPFRQPTLLHPHSNHPFSKLAEQTFHSSVYRSVQIATQPGDSLQT